MLNKKDYTKESPAQGVKTLNNWGGIVVIDFDCDCVIWCYDFGEREALHRSKVYYKADGGAYFLDSKSQRHSFGDFQRVGAW